MEGSRPLMDSFIQALQAVRNRFVMVTYDESQKTQTCSDYANWVVPGKIMCGPYPWLDEGHGKHRNFPTLATANANIEAIIEDGVNTFVCLQSEVDPYATYGKLSIIPRILHFPMPNDTTPSPGTFIEHLTILGNALANEDAVLYVHCAGGHGRTGVYVACLLMMLFDDMIAQKALDLVQRFHDEGRRKVDARCPSGCASPVTPQQFELVRRFEHLLKWCGV